MTSIRTCLGCGQRKPKREMLRIVWQGHSLTVDYANTLPGRGGYFCGNEHCAQRLGRGKLKAKPPGGHADAAHWRALMAGMQK